MGRLGKRIADGLDHLLVPLAREGVFFLSEGVLWRCDQDPAVYTEFRLPERGSSRDLEEVPLVELANACGSVLRDGIAMPQVDSGPWPGCLGWLGWV